MRSFVPWSVAALLTVAVALLAADLAGVYKGTWSGSSGASGDFRVALTPGNEGKWKAEVTFTFSGDNIKTNVKAVDVDGNKLKIVYEFDLQDTRLESTITGELTGKTLAGSYVTKAAADGSAVDEGTWKTAASE